MTLSYIVEGFDHLDPRNRERGGNGRSTAPLSWREPADLDVLVLTDPRTGVLAVLMHWAGRIRHGLRLEHVAQRSVSTEAALIEQHWAWALTQPWAPQMGAELAALADRIHEIRHGVPVRPCPVCGEPVRVDRFTTEHRNCLDSTAGQCV